MAEDIAPALLEKIQADFATAFEADKTIKALYAVVEAGTATYAQANEFAVRTGALLAKALKANLSSSVLPDGRMYYNIAKSLLTPTFRRNYELITGVTSRIQESLNAAAGTGLKAQVPKFNQDRLDGIIDRLSSEPDFDQVSWILREPVVNFSQSVVDDCVKVNAQFLRGAGLRPKIVRTLRGRACPWCKALAGTYYYDEDNVPDDIYRRHDNCRCTVEVFTETGDRQTVHSGTEGKRRYVKDKYGGYELTEEAKIARRKEMESTAAERAKAAREKRIATWAKKKEERRIASFASFDAEHRIKSPEERLPNYSKAVIPSSKLSGYALDMDHPDGRAKAIAFRDALGYTSDNEADLIAELRNGLEQWKAVPRNPTMHGQPFEVKMLITGPNGKRATVKTAWQIDVGQEIPRLISAYVYEE